MTPRYTDTHRYPHGYRKWFDTDIRQTIERAKRELESASHNQLDKYRAKHDTSSTTTKGV